MAEVLFSNEHLRGIIMRSLEKKFHHCKLATQSNKITITKPQGGEVEVTISKDSFKINPKLSKRRLALWAVLGAIVIHILNQFVGQLSKLLVLLGIMAIILVIVCTIAQLTQSNTKSEQLADQIKRHLEEELR